MGGVLSLTQPTFAIARLPLAAPADPCGACLYCPVVLQCASTVDALYRAADRGEEVWEQRESQRGVCWPWPCQALERVLEVWAWRHELVGAGCVCVFRRACASCGCTRECVWLCGPTVPRLCLDILCLCTVFLSACVFGLLL